MQQKSSKALALVSASTPKGGIIIYKTKDGKTKIDVKLEKETIWLNAHQMADLFCVDRTVIVKHMHNIYKIGELKPKLTCAKNAQVAKDGKVRNIDFYNLDMIISVGYRVNSLRGTEFRIWATKILRNHIVKGFTVNKKRLEENRQKSLIELEKTIALLKSSMQNKALDYDEALGLLQVITDYANSWILLQKYDENALKIKKQPSRRAAIFTYPQAKKAIEELKAALISKKETTDLFGREREHGLDAIFGAINQTFNGKHLYRGFEEKAAHLFYFIIKDHPFVDGNKRAAAFLFILFLSRNNRLFNEKGERKINDVALVALALLIAQSNPKDKEIMIALITNLV
ncbi:virulence protein RhuM/Fic/DOC family protein [Candidatus Peregrinibacteria bacterium]|nr:virulence protein RhuM/Fic/DOC family protein [Candidatus Peregrinibacteria bacterium]